MADPSFYLFDGYNLLHAGGVSDRRELVDRLAGYLAVRGARGVVVFDGAGEESSVGPLAVRFASPADRLIERLAAEHRDAETICVVSSDRAVRETAGRQVRLLSARTFLRELEQARPDRRPPASQRSSIADALDEETRVRLDRWRRRH